MELSDSPPAFFGDLLKAYRKRAKLTQHQLATLLSVHLNTVWAWERGEHLPDTRSRVLELAKALRLSAQDTQRLLEASLLAVGPSLGGLTGRLPTHPPVRDPLLPPDPVTGLIGRDGLLAHLTARLTSGATLALSAVQGLPGVGKTTLALALAHAPEVRSYFADGLLWTGLGQTPRVSETLARWGTLLGLAPEQAARLSSMQSWAEALRTAIGERRLLLVLDDAWQLDDVLACLVGGEGCATLITTRRPDLALQVAGVDCLAVPELSTADGLTLLERLAPQVVKAEPEAARDLVEAVGGLPLGLVLLGKRLQLHSYGSQPRRVQAALERLKHRSERLQVAQAQAPAASHSSLPAGTPLSLEASIGLSVAALDAPAQAMLQALAVFPPKPMSFPEEAALRVAEGRPETLDALVDAGLVESRGAGRYTLHQTIADFAWVQGRPKGVEERLVTYMVAFVQQHQGDYAPLDLELMNIQTAFDLAA